MASDKEFTSAELKIRKRIWFLRRELSRIHLRERWANQEISKAQEKCQHLVVKAGDKAICSICDKNLGWWCKTSPRNFCDYSKKADDGPVVEFSKSDYCKYCGQPEERK